jgi:hypothetical protein
LPGWNDARHGTRNLFLQAYALDRSIFPITLPPFGIQSLPEAKPERALYGFACSIWTYVIALSKVPRSADL